jgi:two-component system, chemotaxis family, chemotaxis protein CheY
MLEQSGLREAGPEDLVRPGAAPSAAPRLLVLDDDNLHRMIICRVAAKAGFLPAGAASYDEAAQLVQEIVFDCITLDLSLGEHDGAEMLRHLWVVGCRVPVIIISGCDDATCSETEKVAESLKLNVWESIPKPVNMAVLRDSLERLKAAREQAAIDVQASPQISPE